MNRVFHIAGLTWLIAGYLILYEAMNPITGMLTGAAALVLLLACGRMPSWAYAAATAFCACSVSFALYNGAVIMPAQSFAQTVQPVQGVVTDSVDYGTYRSATLLLDHEKMPQGLAGESILLSLNAALDVDIGDVIKCNVKLDCDEDVRLRLYPKGIRFKAVPVGEPFIIGTQNTLAVKVARYREGIYRNITKNLTGSEGDVLAGMLVGRTENISPVIKSNYARAGISHLLSVSGLHLAVLSGLLEILLGILRFSKIQRGLISMTAVFLFMALAGFSHSVMRSGIMLLLCLAASLLGRDSDTLNSLGAALVVILVDNPYAAFSLSLQLSYLATMGIAAFATPLSNWFSKRYFSMTVFELRESRPRRCALLLGVSTTVCATILTAPLVCWYFGQLSLVSALVNVMIAPLEPVALGCGLLVGFTGFFPPLRVVTRILALAGGVSVKLINETAAWWAELPFAAVSVSDEYIIFWMTAVILAGILLWYRRVPHEVMRYAAKLSVLCLLAGAFSGAAVNGTEVSLAVANHGQSVLLSCGKQAALIGAPESIYEARNLTAFLKDSRVEKLVFIAAEKEDHLYGNPVMELTNTYPADKMFGLDTTYGFQANLFGCVTVRSHENEARVIEIDLGGRHVVKTFEQYALPADILINARNEIICAPNVKIKARARYFNSTVMTWKMPSGAGGIAGQAEQRAETEPLQK